MLHSQTVDPYRGDFTIERGPRLNPRALRSEAGQTTAEYALVLLAAATIAMLVVAWAGTGAIDDLFDAIMDNITSMIP